MDTTFVKYCPACGDENLSIASFCEGCDFDLMNAPAVMRQAEPSDQETPSSSANGSSGIFQEATTDTQKQAITAPQDETATRRVAMAPEGVLRLELIADPQESFTVRAGQSVGRSARADVVLHGIPDLEYISRAHVRFLQRRKQWYVQYIAEGNSISVDGVESSDDSEVAIYDESIIKLSFTAFRVRLD